MFAEMRAMAAKVQEVRRNAGMTRPEFEAMKLEKFRALVRFANERSPFYARIVRDRNIDLATCVPGDFPVLDISIVMAKGSDPELGSDPISDFSKSDTRQMAGVAFEHR